MVLQDLFPETLLRAVIYPSDLLFYSIWAIAKWFVDPVTREKVQPMMYLSGVEQFIDRHFIPKSMVCMRVPVNFIICNAQKTYQPNCAVPCFTIILGWRR